MKKIVGFDEKIGGDGLAVAGALGIEGSDMVADVKLVFPLAKIVDPVMGVVDGLVDKVEKLIPGDQTTLAAQLKLEAREAIVKLLSEPKA